MHQGWSHICCCLPFSASHRSLSLKQPACSQLCPQGCIANSSKSTAVVGQGMRQHAGRPDLV